MPPCLSPELELLVTAAQLRAEGSSRARTDELLNRSIHWERILETAASHGVSPLLFRHLNKGSSERVPPAILGELERQFRGNALRNLALTGELLKLLDVLQKHGISAIAYKGPWLASFAYGNLALRQFCDLDIIVPQTDALRTRQILMEQGYQPDFPLTESQQQSHLRAKRPFDLNKNANLVRVEIHWNIAPACFSVPLDYEHLRSRLQTVSLAGRQVLGLGSEDLLIALCVHGAKHVWNRLSWICDVARLIELQPPIALGPLLQRAEAQGTRRAVLLGLYLAGDLLGAPVPEDIWARVLADSKARKLAAQVYEGLQQPDRRSVGFWKIGLFHLGTLERIRHKLAYCVQMGLMPSDRDWDLWRLPKELNFLYFLLRPLRMAGWLPRSR